MTALRRAAIVVRSRTFTVRQVGTEILYLELAKLDAFDVGQVLTTLVLQRQFGSPAANPAQSELISA